jgi:osmotically-inducible protein OsmY
VYGVQGVANELEVQLSPAHERSDTDIARAVVHTLEWNVAIPQERIKVGVSGGRVVLEGTVDREYQRATAERVVRQLVGVRGLANLIRVEPKEQRIPSPEIVKARIEEALTRRARLTAQGISVTINDSQVMVEGTVHSESEHEEVAYAVWNVPGVLSLEDNLSVVP